LDSRNGTFVDGVPISERRLNHGDHIHIGDSALIFLLDDTEAPPPLTTIRLDDGSLPEKPHGRWVLGQPLSTAARQRVRARLLFCSSR
jgi:pSer/pThr/pTyr-binding forkhead associated (FHA) protein